MKQLFRTSLRVIKILTKHFLILQLREEGKMLSGTITVNLRVEVMSVRGCIRNLTIIMFR